MVDMDPAAEEPVGVSPIATCAAWPDTSGPATVADGSAEVGVTAEVQPRPTVVSTATRATVSGPAAWRGQPDRVTASDIT